MARQTREAAARSTSPQRPPLWYNPLTGLILALVLGGVLRLAAFGEAPPGLNQDEAVEAWNAACILKTGQDQVGRSWPILYSRCLGEENRSTLYMYLLIPFEIVGGMSPLTNRLPSPLIGIATIALTYFVGRRLFGPSAGIVAAVLLALNPWHIQLSRWGHQAILCPFLAVGGVASLLWMGLGVDGRPPKPRMIGALLAGVFWGISTWAYPSSRIFAVTFFVILSVLAWRAWVEFIKTPGGLRALLGFAFVGGAFVLPMVYYHLRYPEIMSARLSHTAVFREQDSGATKLWKMAQRYPGHFGPDFLFLNGDTYEIQSPPGFGEFHWYMAPLMIVGLILTIGKARSNYAARLLLAWLLVYPLGDVVSTHFNNSMHALRSSPGIPGLILLGTAGAVGAGTWLWRQSHGGAIAVAGMAAILVVILNVRFLYYFFGEYNDRPFIYHAYHVDLLKACDWLRPRLGEVDAVFVTTRGMNMPYVISLVGLHYDPHKWFSEPREFQTTGGGWDVYTRYGKIHFMYGASATPALKELINNKRQDRVIFIVRPGDLNLQKPTLTINGPPGTGPLWICEQTL